MRRIFGDIFIAIFAFIAGLILIFTPPTGLIWIIWGFVDIALSLLVLIVAVLWEWKNE
jgi:hypothetical protein